MKASLVSFLKRFCREERGQVIPLAAVSLLSLIGMGGLTIDVGSLYSARAQLQNSVNSAALSAAGSVWNGSSSSTSAVSVATSFLNNFYQSTYSVDFSDGNSHSIAGLGSTAPATVRTVCLNSLITNGSTCTSTTAKNAVLVSQTATAPTFFMAIFGVRSVPVTATAIASMLGQAQPWNVAILLDTTGSMNTTDSNCVINGSTVSQFQCAMHGIQTMLAAISPCPSGSTSCSTDTSLFRVGLFIFPAFKTSQRSYLYASYASNRYYLNNGYGACTAPSVEKYPLPLETATSVTMPTYTYNLTTYNSRSVSSSQKTLDASYNVLAGASGADANGFTSDYYLPTGTNGLNTSSNLVKALSGCIPIAGYINDSNPSGLYATGSNTGGTYFASVIYAAQQALLLEQSNHSGSKNAIILLTDGQANLVKATGNLPYSGISGASTPDTWSVASGSGARATLTDTTGAYPSYTNQCQQAIVAAQKATQAGTRVYSVAYGSQAAGCGSQGSDGSAVIVDSSKLSSFPLTLNADFSVTSLTPCVAMENIASSLTYFYSDYLQANNNTSSSSKVDTSCVDNSHSVTALDDIFRSIAGTFTYPRLLPSNSAGYLN